MQGIILLVCIENLYPKVALQGNVLACTLFFQEYKYHPSNNPYSWSPSRQIFNYGVEVRPWRSFTKVHYYRPQTKFAKVLFSQVSVCPGGTCVPFTPCHEHPTVDRHPPPCTPCRACHPAMHAPCHTCPPPRTTLTTCGQWAGGMHSTGMHSCVIMNPLSECFDSCNHWLERVGWGGGCVSLRSIITNDINDIINDITDNHYRPQTKLREGNVFHRCLSVCTSLTKINRILN